MQTICGALRHSGGLSDLLNHMPCPVNKLTVTKTLEVKKKPHIFIKTCSYSIWWT